MVFYSVYCGGEHSKTHWRSCMQTHTNLDRARPQQRSCESSSHQKAVFVASALFPSLCTRPGPRDLHCKDLLCSWIGPSGGAHAPAWSHCRYNYTNGIRGIDAELRLQHDANRFEPTFTGSTSAGLAVSVSQGCEKAVADSGGCSTEAVLLGLQSGSCSRQELVALCD